MTLTMMDYRHLIVILNGTQITGAQAQTIATLKTKLEATIKALDTQQLLEPTTSSN